MSPDFTQTGAATSPPPAQPTPASPPPAPAPQTQPAPPAPTLGSGPGSSGVTGGTGVVPPPGASTPPPDAPPAPPADWQQQLAQLNAYRQKAQEYEQYKHLIPLGYAAYQRQAQPGPSVVPPAAGQPQPAANPFGLPQFDFNLLSFISKDPSTGQLQLLPGAPPDALARYQDYQEKLHQAQRQFWSEPQKFLLPMIQEEAKKIAAQQFREQYQGIQSQQTASQILQQNADWLYAKDQGGQPQFRYDPATGQNRPVLSELGQQYGRLIQSLDAQGVRDPNAQHQLAVAQLQNMLYQAQQRQAAAGQTQQTQQQTFLQGNQAPLVPVPAAPPAVVPPPPQGGSLREILAQRMNQAGMTDDLMRRQLQGAA